MPIKDGPTMQEEYEELAEKWAVEMDRGEERYILLQIIALLCEAKSKKEKIRVDDWIKQAIKDEVKEIRGK